MKPVLATLGILGVLGVFGVFGAGAFIYSGVFNVAATVRDAAPLRWVLITTREASIRRHAQSIRAPAVGGAQQVENGFRIYRTACATCHTPPGVAATSTAKGLNPQAPALGDLVDMKDAELFWVTKNGIRFTGMPASGSSYTDAQIWELVTFLRTSSGMNAAAYDTMDRLALPEPQPQK